MNFNFPYRDQKFKEGDRVRIWNWERFLETMAYLGGWDADAKFSAEWARGVHVVTGVRKGTAVGYSPQDLKTDKSGQCTTTNPWCSSWWFDLAPPPEEGEL